MLTKYKQQHIILVHGIWMTPLFLFYYYRRLKKRCYNIHLFSYTPTITLWDENLDRLDRLIEHLPNKHVHFIAHSLGGLLVCDYLQRYSLNQQGRAVLLASPISGSSTARRLSQHFLGRKILGHSRDILCQPEFTANKDWETAGIAGTCGLGISRILGKLDKPHDGVVRVSETQNQWLTDHLSLPVSHSGILVSKKAASQSIYFLEHGIFKPS